MHVDLNAADGPAEERVSTKVITAVADANGVDPLELETPLYDVVDPEALDALFQPRGTRMARTDVGRLTFTIDGCEVAVDSDGRVTATPLEANDERRHTDARDD